MVVYYIENRIKELNSMIKLMEYNLEHCYNKRDYAKIEARLDKYKYALDEILAIYEKIKEYY